MSLRATAASGVVWTTVEGGTRQLLGLIIFLALARLLDRHAFGLVALAGVHIGFIQVFVTQGLGTAVIQRKDLTPAHLDAAFWMSMGAAAVLAALTVAFREVVATQLGDVAAADLLGALAMTLPMAAANLVPAAILARDMRFRALAVRSTIATAAGGIVGVTAALWNAGAWALVMQQLVSAAVGVAYLWVGVSWRPGTRATGQALKGLALFGAGMVGNNLLWFVSQRIDQAVIGRGLGVEALGVYAVAMRVLTLVIETLTTPTASVALPLFSRLQHERAHLARVYVRSTTLICALGFPVFVGLALVAQRLVPILLGLKWQPVILPLQILCGAGLLRVVQTFVHPTFMALGRPGTYTLTFALLAGTNTLGSLLASGHGIAAVGCAVITAYGVTGLANFVVLGRYVNAGLGSILRPLVPVAIACAGMGAVVAGVDLAFEDMVHDAVTLTVECITGSMTYALLLARLAPDVWGELARMAAALRDRQVDVPAPGGPTT